MTMVTAGDSTLTCQEHHNRFVVGVQKEGAARTHTQTDPAPSALNAVTQRSTTEKRHAPEDGLNGEEEDRGKLQRLGEQPDEFCRQLPCHFSVRYRNNLAFKKCGPFKDWKSLREHLIIRRHRPREQCQNCGDFFDSDKWEQHTRARACQKRQEPFGPPISMDGAQERAIRCLGSQGTKSKLSLQETWYEVWEILFPGVHCTFRPFSKVARQSWHTDESNLDSRAITGHGRLESYILGLPEMEALPENSRLNLATSLATKFHHIFERWKQIQDDPKSIDTPGIQSSMAEHPGDNFEQLQQSFSSESGVPASQTSISDRRHSLDITRPLSGASFPDSYLLGEERADSQTDLLSSHYQCRAASVHHFDAASARPQLRDPLYYNFDASSSSINPALFRGNDPTPTPSILLSMDSSCQLPLVSEGLPSSPVEHHGNRTAPEEHSWGPSLNYDSSMNRRDTWDAFFLESFGLETYGSFQEEQ